MKSRILATRLAQVAMVLTFAGSTVRVLHFFEDNNSTIAYILLGAGIVLMALAVILRSRNMKQLEKENQQLEEEVKQLKHK
ncbi:hypothetical protein [Pontibacter ruber]|uniref:Uncharacterized protein n=1 Tax=Pontibacter ruber TaxID=1343895 RepID=A0ABW5D131_9BACT|nr:hypothetical protein [Pontibacter ruber]